MQEIFNKAYNGLKNAVDSFANSSVDTVQPKITEKKTAIKPNYVYPCDNYIDVVLNNPITRQALHAIAIKYYCKQIKEITINGTKLTNTNYPRLWNIYQQCRNVLGINTIPSLYITSKLSGVNALSVEVADEQLILLSYQAAIMLKDTEQRFLLGHELGHIQLGHLTAHTVQGLLQDLNKRVELLGPIVTDIIDVPLNHWYRTSEFAADRAGYLCCKDMKAIAGIFRKLDTAKPTNAYIQYKELSDAYPRMSTRLEVLQKFATTNNKICQ